MILISNHLLSLPGFTVRIEDAVVRINMAWVKDGDALHDAIAHCGTHDVFLDFPYGRTKPPVPEWQLDEAVAEAWKYMPRFFAVSNVEDPDVAADIEGNLPEKTMLVPKIESLKGVLCLTDILKRVDTSTIMLDTEDLFSGCNDQKTFLAAVDNVHKVCEQFDVEVLRLYGVIFSEA